MLCVAIESTRCRIKVGTCYFLLLTKHSFNAESGWYAPWYRFRRHIYPSLENENPDLLIMSQLFGSLDWRENKSHFCLQLCSDVILDSEGTSWWEPFHSELRILSAKINSENRSITFFISDPIGVAPLTWSNSTIRCVKFHVRKVNTCTVAHCVHSFCW